MIVFSVTFFIIGTSTGVYVLSNYFPEPEITQQSPPNVITNSNEPSMNKELLDRCVILTIDMVKAEPYDDGKSVEYTNDKDVVSKRTEWKLLDCASVEHLVTETYEWKNRNNLEQ